MIKAFIYSVYKLAGYLLSYILLFYWSVRDRIFPPESKYLLVVAHPDDDVLFFHSFLKEHKPYVVLMTTSWSLHRVVPFYRAMYHYKVRYRAYNLGAKETREDVIKKHLRKVSNLGHFEVCATHNKDGEYGHVMHKCIHRCVRESIIAQIICPVSADELQNYPLPEKAYCEKKEIIDKYYYSEKPVLEKYFPAWIKYEKLTLID